MREAGQPVAAIASRDPEHAEAGARFAGGGVRAVSYEELPGLASHILITVTDDAILPVADRLAAAGMSGGVALHACGSIGPELLAPLAARGVVCGVLHPMQTVPSPELGLSVLRKVTWSLTGEGAAEEWAREIAGALDGRLIHIAAEHRALYHASAVMACNNFIALLDAAAEMMEVAGLERADGLETLRPLVEATVRNVFAEGTEASLSGPLARGNVETVARHLESLGALPERVDTLFRAAGVQILDIARRRGLDPDRVREIDGLLSAARQLRHNR